MYKNSFLKIISILLLSTSLYANDARVEAEKLFQVIEMDKTMNKLIDLLLDQEMNRNPSLVPYKEVFKKFLYKHIGYKNIKEEMIDIYVEYFTADELKDITNFYQTKTGSKAFKLFPQISAKGNQLGFSKVQNNLQELQKMIQEEAKRIESLQKKN